MKFISTPLERALGYHFNRLVPADNLILSQCEAVVSDLLGVVDRRITQPSGNLTANLVSGVEWFRLGDVVVTEIP